MKIKFKNLLIYIFVIFLFNFFFLFFLKFNIDICLENFYRISLSFISFSAISVFMYFILSEYFIFKKLERVFNKILQLSDNKQKNNDESVLIIKSLNRLENKIKSLAKELNSAYNQTIAFSQQLAVYSKELEYANRRLVDLENIKKNFIASISHELKTPLGVIIGYNELLLSEKIGKISGGQKKSLSVTKRNLMKLSSLIENMIDYSRIVYGEINIKKERVDLYDIIEFAYNIVHPNIEEKNINFKNNFEKNQFFVYVDKERIIHLFVNIYLNSIKFTENGGFTETGIQKEKNGSYYIYIKDNGIGIEKNKLDKIFEHFYQVDQSYTKQYSGIGLGLTIVKAVVDLHDGDLFVESQPGVGTTIIFSCQKA
ncbi:MAG: sensor histidine kinase [Candidatus Muiribacteriota bacterium]